jgi:hypothetical protein
VPGALYTTAAWWINILQDMQTLRSLPEPQQYVSSATRMLDRRRQMIELQQELGKQQAVYAEKARFLVVVHEYTCHLCIRTKTSGYTVVLACLPGGFHGVPGNCQAAT